jgi:hypothetical protein
MSRDVRAANGSVIEVTGLLVAPPSSPSHSPSHSPLPSSPLSPLGGGSSSSSSLLRHSPPGTTATGLAASSSFSSSTVSPNRSRSNLLVVPGGPSGLRRSTLGSALREIAASNVQEQLLVLEAAFFTADGEASARWRSETPPPLLPFRPTKVFGKPLSLAVRRSRVPGDVPVPAVVRRCVDYLDAKALREEGVYRLCGSKGTINELLESFDNGIDVNLLEANVRDPHVVAGLLKQYLRDLPAAVGASLRADDSNLALLRREVRQLREEELALLSVLVPHLRRIIAESALNKMTRDNITIIFSSTLRMAPRVLDSLIGGGIADADEEDAASEDDEAEIVDGDDGGRDDGARNDDDDASDDVSGGEAPDGDGDGDGENGKDAADGNDSDGRSIGGEGEGGGVGDDGDDGVGGGDDDGVNSGGDAGVGVGGGVGAKPGLASPMSAVLRRVAAGGSTARTRRGMTDAPPPAVALGKVPASPPAAEGPSRHSVGLPRRPPPRRWSIAGGEHDEYSDVFYIFFCLFTFFCCCHSHHQNDDTFTPPSMTAAIRAVGPAYVTAKPPCSAVGCNSVIHCCRCGG